MKTLEVCERTMDYWINERGQRMPKFHVQVKGKAGCWACGRSVAEAIGDLIQHHPESFGIKTKILGKMAR